MNKVILIAGGALLIGLAGGYTVFKTTSKPQSTNNAPMQGTVPQDGQLNGWGNRNGNNGDSMPREGGQPNRGNCLADDCLMVTDLEYPAGELTESVQSALVEAINDEYKALATYQAVVSELGSTRPFSMIIGAEEQHIASLRAIFEKYGVEVPENTWASKVTAPATLQEACQTGVDAEIANAALYKDKLLPAVNDYEDITRVFTNLMNASQQKHLPAFEKCN